MSRESAIRLPARHGAAGNRQRFDPTLLAGECAENTPYSVVNDLSSITVRNRLMLHSLPGERFEVVNTVPPGLSTHLSSVALSKAS